MLILAGAALASPALAQANAQASSQAQVNTSANAQAGSAAEPTLADTKPSWTLQFEPAAWYVAPSGKLTLPSDGAKGERLNLSSLNIDTPRLSPAGELHFRTSDRWRFTLSAAYFDIDSRESTRDSAGRFGNIDFAAGDVFSTQFEFFTADLLAAYALVPEHAVNNDKDLLFGLDLVGGLSLYNTEFKVNSGASSASASLFMADPVLGLKADATLCEHFTIDLQTTFGYMALDGDSIFSWDIIVGFAYRPVEWLGFQIGYRNLFVSLKSDSGADEYKWRGGLAGLYGGIELRF